MFRIACGKAVVKAFCKVSRQKIKMQFFCAETQKACIFDLQKGCILGGASQGGDCSLLAPKENQKGRRCPEGMKAPVGLLSRRPVCEANAACSARQGRSDFDALDPRIKGCSPLIIPKEKSKRKNASRFAKRIFRVSPISSRCATVARPTAANAISRYDPIL